VGEARAALATGNKGLKEADVSFGGTREERKRLSPFEV
jgi:hypothetical protein